MDFCPELANLPMEKGGRGRRLTRSVATAVPSIQSEPPESKERAAALWVSKRIIIIRRLRALIRCGHGNE